MRCTGRPRPIPGGGSTLYDKVRRRDVLWRAWVAVRRNDGAPGIDKITLAAVEEYGIDRLLGELAAEVEEGRYRPMPARRVYIPKPGVRDEQRPLSIPPVRDRIVQAAVKIVLEPVFEADFLPCSGWNVAGGRVWAWLKRLGSPDPHAVLVILRCSQHRAVLGEHAEWWGACGSGVSGLRLFLWCRQAGPD
jgi:hypothetical protein